MKPPEAVLPEGWVADDISLTCPHGHRREHDGVFNECSCTNPLRSMGFI